MDSNRSSDVLNRDDEAVVSTPAGRLGQWKSRGIELLGNARQTVSRRTQAVSHAVVERTSRVTPAIHDTMARADRDMHTNPGKWAGIAAGAAFALGMLGRDLRHRVSRRRRFAPDLIIVETA